MQIHVVARGLQLGGELAEVDARVSQRLRRALPGLEQVRVQAVAEIVEACDVAARDDQQVDGSPGEQSEHDDHAFVFIEPQTARAARCQGA